MTRILAASRRKGRNALTCVAIYAMDGRVTRLMPWRRAFPARVAFGSFSTELGDVKTCLYAWATTINDLKLGIIRSHHDEKRTPKKTLPRVFGIIVVSMVKEHRPLISTDH
jgi:hypothetical protein